MELVATLATFNAGPPADTNDPRVALLRQTLRESPGFVAGYHLAAADGSEAYSLVVFENAKQLGGAMRALQDRPGEHKIGVDPDRVTHLKAYRF
ncbi:MAG: hypothetical protein WAL63_21530 [Solirubrobacteraceae bacterium]